MSRIEGSGVVQKRVHPLVLNVFYVFVFSRKKTLSMRGMSRMEGTGVVQKRGHPLVLSVFFTFHF